jgi:rhamnosyltransferase
MALIQGSIYCIIPTYQAGAAWSQSIEALEQQTAITPEQVLIVDSSSKDNTVFLSEQAGFCVHVIPSAEFNHGGTRQLAVSLLPDADVVVFLTQDALLGSPDSIQKLVAAFDDPKVGCAYGRQLPHKNAAHFGTHARLFNYPDVSYIRTMVDVPKYGIKTAFLSNSFAAYRVSALKEVGGFPAHVILAEDMIVAAKMLQAGYQVAYVADACVYHSHDYTPRQEFKRYFDIGVLHAKESWLLETFGAPTGEGKRFVLSEWRYLLKNAPWLLPLSVINTGMKWCGYQMGKHEAYLPAWAKVKLSMYKGYWRS